MSGIASNITITLFGLEKDLWEQTGETEQASYKTAMICFVLFYLLSVVSSVYLIYMITISWWSAIPAGLLVSLIIGSVVRFSMIILRRSIFDQLQNKPAVAATPQQPAAAASTSTSKDWKAIFKKIKFKWPESNAKVPGFAGAIRLVIMTVMGLLVLFPLACFLHRGSIEPLNQEKREAYIRQFEEDAQKSLATKVGLIQKEINAIEADLVLNASIYQQDGLVKEKKAAIVRLKALLEEETKEHNESHQNQLLHFKENIDGQYFMAMSFKAVARMPLFLISLIAIGLLLFLPHLFLFRLKTQAGQTYAERSTDHYRHIIDTEYEKTTTEGYAHLKKKFNYDPKGYSKHVYWENPPYCTVPHQPFPPRVEVTKEAFLKSFETKGTA